LLRVWTSLINTPLGKNGEVLHAWLFGRNGQQPNDVDRQAAQEMFSETGAFIIGRTTYDVGVPEWGDDGAFGMPCFVMTHRLRAQHVMGPTSFNFVGEGPEAALAKARAEAGGKGYLRHGRSDDRPAVHRTRPAR
jgi:dihydrofolate reductase